MKSEGKSNINITFINTKTAITGSGSAVVFYTVNDLLKRFGIEIKNRSDDSKRQYNHEYAALTSVYPKAGSRFIPFESLVGNGLFDLYPQLEDVDQRRNVRLHLAVTDLRNFGFSAERALSREQIDVAARLVFSFMSCADTHSTEINEKIEMHMLAWFLALRKRKRRDTSLEAWLDAHASIALEKTANTPDHPSAHLEDVEISQYKELASYLANRTLLGGRVSDSTRIDHAIIARERAMWRAWRQASRDSHLAQRAERIERGDYPRQPRRSKNQSRSSRFMDDDYHHRERSRNPRRSQRPRDRTYWRRQQDW